MSLGGVVALAGFSTWKSAAMILTYSLTCPVGIAVGMGIAETYDEESERARGVQGAFNGVSGGMLLYIALVQVRAGGRAARGGARARINLNTLRHMHALRGPTAIVSANAGRVVGSLQ